MKLISCKGTIVVLVDNDGADNRSCELKLKKLDMVMFFKMFPKKDTLKFKSIISLLKQLDGVEKQQLGSLKENGLIDEISIFF